MKKKKKKKTRRRRSFTPEFEAEIVELCRRGDREIGHMARDFDLTETKVRTRVKHAEIDQGERPGQTSAKRRSADLPAPWRNRRLEIVNEMFKRANSFVRSYVILPTAQCLPRVFSADAGRGCSSDWTHGHATVDRSDLIRAWLHT